MTSTLPAILVTNDDGVRAPGLQALARFARTWGDVYVCAPDREQSATSHSLTLHRPLRVQPEGPQTWSVDGTPTDAVHLAIEGGVLPRRPALLLSGINHGGNLGDEITYSGTVAAAMEGALLGVPAVAFSCLSRDPRHDELDTLAPWISRVVDAVRQHGLPPATLLNVNFPDPRRGPLRGLRVTRQGKRVYGAAVVEKTDPRDRKYYWIAGAVMAADVVPGSDVEAVDAGYAALTPVHLDLTDYRLMETLREWRLDEPR